MNGFIGYIRTRGDGQMTATRYHVMRHIQRVQHHLFLEVEESDMDAFAGWAWAANALCFLPDGCVRNPAGLLLVDPEGGEPDADAEPPYPRDAYERKEVNDLKLGQLGIPALDTLPPSVGEPEVLLRSPEVAARRAQALFVVAVRAGSLAEEDVIPVKELKESLPGAFKALSPEEETFIETEKPEQQAVVDSVWRYEALYLLQWALGLVEKLPLPSETCDVATVAGVMLSSDPEEFVKKATLRPTSEILDALDLHFRIHWAVRQSGVDENNPPAGLDQGVVAERHHALNWLVSFGDAEWDEVETPT